MFEFEVTTEEEYWGVDVGVTLYLTVGGVSRRISDDHTYVSSRVNVKEVVEQMKGELLDSVARRLENDF